MTRTILAVIVLAQPVGAQGEAEATATEITVFDGRQIWWQEDSPERVEPDGFVMTYTDQVAQRFIDLPATPKSQSEAMRIIATVRVEPIVNESDEAEVTPNDRWTRLGNFSVFGKGPDGKSIEVELVRFITGFGAPGVFEEDVTALAPLLHGRRQLRIWLSSYSDQPGWDMTATLRYEQEKAGYRRPETVIPIAWDQHHTAAEGAIEAKITIPDGLMTPRMRVLTTGHSTDGLGGDEFITRTHELHVDGKLIASWRPWVEPGVETRDNNPWARRFHIDDRTVWSSDVDRSGWAPGRAVIPTLIPLPELTPGEHTIRLHIKDIRPKDPSKRPPGATNDEKVPHGFWVLSASVVADEPWPKPSDD